LFREFSDALPLIRHTTRLSDSTHSLFEQVVVQNSHPYLGRLRKSLLYLKWQRYLRIPT